MKNDLNVNLMYDPKHIDKYHMQVVELTNVNIAQKCSIFLCLLTIRYYESGRLREQLSQVQSYSTYIKKWTYILYIQPQYIW